MDFPKVKRDKAQGAYHILGSDNFDAAVGDSIATLRKLDDDQAKRLENSMLTRVEVGPQRAPMRGDAVLC